MLETLCGRLPSPPRRLNFGNQAIKLLLLLKLFFEVSPELACQHPVILTLREQVLGVRDPVAQGFTPLVERFLLCLELLILFAMKTLHFACIRLVAPLEVHRVAVQKSVGRIKHGFCPNGLALVFAIERIAAVVKIPLQRPVGLFLRSDACGHGVLAGAANDHAAHEVGSNGPLRLDDLREPELLVRPVILRQRIELLRRYDGLEIELFKQVDDLASEDIGTGVKRIAENIGQQVDVYLDPLPVRAACLDGVALPLKPGGYLLERVSGFLRQTHFKRLLEQPPILPIRTGKAVGVLVVAVFWTVVKLPFGGNAVHAALHVLRVLVAELLCLNESDAEHHLSRRVVVEVVAVRKLDVLDVAPIEQVNDLPRLLHVAGQAVGSPGQDRVVIPLEDFFEHEPEDRPVVRHLCRLFFVVGRQHAEPLPLRRLLALYDLVTDGTLLFFSRVRALSSINDVAKRGGLLIRHPSFIHAKSSPDTGYEICGFWRVWDSHKTGAI